MAFWGICYDEKICRGKLFRRPVLYTVTDGAVHITEPVEAETITANIRPTMPPMFGYGDEVTVFEHPEKQGTVREIIWNPGKLTFNYKLYINGKKKFKRYKEYELMRTRKEK